MRNRIQAIRGVRDIFSTEAAYWLKLENALRTLAGIYGYQYIKLPILEQTLLFQRSIGDGTDIVSKEMYTFADKNGDSLTMRPEGTAGCVRAVNQHSLAYGEKCKLWYNGPMFRHERPQKGRYRQFEQFGMEAFGFQKADIEVDMLLFCHRLWEQLGLTEHVNLHVNTIGDLASREKYKAVLLDYLNSNAALIGDDIVRMRQNPLRMLDSKRPELAQIIADAPRLADYLSAESADFFAYFLDLLDKMSIKYNLKPSLVRGLDYYNDTVFEWSTDRLGAQSEICAGGRYDGLVADLGGKPNYAVGFAIGLDRVINLLECTNQLAKQHTVDVYLATEYQADIRARAYSLLEQWRTLLPSVKFQACLEDTSLKKQLQQANKHGAKYVVIIGGEEFAADTISVKFLNADIPQKMYTTKEFSEILIQEYKNDNG